MVRREKAKNWLCLKAGIRLFRILPSGAEAYDNCICLTLPDNRIDSISMGVQAIFDMLKIDVDVDIRRDVLEIKKFGYLT